MKIPPIIKTFLFPLIFLFLFSVVGYFSFIKKPQNIEIVYDKTFNSLNPYTYSDFNNSPLNYMYETLIKYDQNLKLAPSLAVSYGRIDDLTIEFKLKKNVQFHSGQSLNSRVVKESFEVIKSESNLKDFLQNFKEIEVIDDLTFRILLEKNDPLVFSKLAIIPIANFNTIQDLESKPNGTGYYKFLNKTENQISLELNQDYHSNLPDFNNL